MAVTEYFQRPENTPEDPLKRVFPDKKHREIDVKASTQVIKDAQKVIDKARVGQDEATFRPDVEYPTLPIGVLCATDLHYGSTRTAYDLLQRHLDLVENTPNMTMVSNGDNIDNFNAMVHPTGMTENPLPNALQGRTMEAMLKQLDDKGKIGVLSYGNHDDFGFVAGQEFQDTFLSEMNCPVFSAGGVLHIDVGDQEYNLGLSHTYWGKSKINPTNAPKRFMEYECPDADIAFLGHTHQSTFEHFDRAGKDVVAIVGGTYKLDDLWAKKMGIGGRAGKPGITLMLWPDERKIEVFKDIENAATFVRGLIALMKEEDEK